MDHREAALLLTLASLGATCTTTPDRPATTPTEQPFAQEVPIPLEGPVAQARAEVSGITWCGDLLMLLPQFPSRFDGGPAGALFAIPRAQIEEVIAGARPSVAPTPVALTAPALVESIEDYEGFEAMVCHEDRVVLAIEVGGEEATGLLVPGRLEGGSEGHLSVVVDPSRRVSIPQPVGSRIPLRNLAYETLVATDSGEVVAIHESNASWIVPSATAHRFASDLSSLGDAEVPPIEYRVTDGTDTDGAGRFWVTNYEWGDDERLRPEGGPAGAVEQLIELRLSEGQIVRTDRPPVVLRPEGSGRNWEGIARLGDRGLLLVTDLHPGTILLFVPLDD